MGGEAEHFFSETTQGCVRRTIALRAELSFKHTRAQAGLEEVVGGGTSWQGSPLILVTTVSCPGEKTFLERFHLVGI